MKKQLHHYFKLLFVVSLLITSLNVEAVESTKGLAMLISANSVDEIADDDELAAAQWFESTYSEGLIITTADLAQDSLLLESIITLWVHIDRVGDGLIPEAFLATGVINPIAAFYKAGGNLLLSGHATQYLVNLQRLSLELKPGIIGAGEGGSNPDVWGVNANIGMAFNHKNHPLYKGLEKDDTSFDHEIFPFIGAGNKEDHNAMWDLNSYGFEGNIVLAFENESTSKVIGTWQHVTDYCCAGIVEFMQTEQYKGRAIAIGTASFEWKQNDAVNAYQSNIEGITANAFAYFNSYEPNLVDSILLVTRGLLPIIDVKGGTLQVSETVFPYNADNKSVSWSIENISGEATVSETGLVTAIADGLVKVFAKANDGSELAAELEISISNQDGVGVANNSMDAISVFPNPAQNEFCVVNSSQIYELTIYESTGRLVKTIVNNGQNIMNVDISALQTGVYVIVLSSNNGNTTHKIIKQQ